MTMQIEFHWQDEPDADGWYWVDFEDGIRSEYLYRLEDNTDWVIKDWGMWEHERVAKIPGKTQ